MIKQLKNNEKVTIGSFFNTFLLKVYHYFSLSAMDGRFFFFKKTLALISDNVLGI